ncbi:hypothetical protein [Xylocopilactobacillus apicola]|uniref:DUF2238 domain-containing protein n=1 Tax=Xylocopilactobacillus apicola TaxID=2932184 RepID=A0AAU9DJ33_9LACO|nr:hypothetical protein [Xylocopilactobacillus apicola]BDR58471.1 hypothetical protein XA3_09120 [Xylocopilactobacillus apicola]
MNHRTIFKLAIVISFVTILSSISVFYLYHSRYLQVLSVVVLVFAPFLIENIFHFYFPSQLIVLYDIFLIASIILGTGFGFYGVPLWDKYLHVFAGFVMSALGLSILLNIFSDEFVKQHYWLIGCYSSSFAALLSILWEIYEYLGDLFLKLNMQRYQSSGGIPYIGNAALNDTMGDLIADVIGALFFFLIFCYQIKNQKFKIDRWRFKKI